MRQTLFHIRGLSAPAMTALCLAASGCNGGTCADFGNCEAPPGDASTFDSSRTDAQGEDAPMDAVDACASQKPDEANGVFVSPSGSDSYDGGSCGTEAMPCRTIGIALLVAATGHKSTMYLATGSYPGDVQLDVLSGVGDGGVTSLEIQGGWSALLDQWTPICDTTDDVASKTVIAGSVSGGSSLNARVTLSSLSIGASSQAVLSLMGGSNTIILRDVELRTTIADAGTGD